MCCFWNGKIFKRAGVSTRCVYAWKEMLERIAIVFNPLPSRLLSSWQAGDGELLLRLPAGTQSLQNEWRHGNNLGSRFVRSLLQTKQVLNRSSSAELLVCSAGLLAMSWMPLWSIFLLVPRVWALPALPVHGAARSRCRIAGRRLVG